MCGGFNANLIREARHLLASLRGKGIEPELHVVGRKGLGYFRYVGEKIAVSRTDISDRPNADDAASLVETLMQHFVSGQLDALYVVYAQFKSAISTPPASLKVLPVEPPARKGPMPDYLLFPSADAIVTELLPAYVAMRSIARSWRPRRASKGPVARQ
jgi:F-type H+-transporting ATPase subunit gamma